MRNPQLCLTLLFWVFFEGFAVAAEKAPRQRLAEVQDIVPLSYRVDLTLDPDKDIFTGSIDIKVDAKKPVQTIWLNGNRIKVDEASLTAAGKRFPAKAVTEGEDFIELRLATLVPAGSAEIHIRYVGRVRVRDSSGVFRAADGGNRYILTQFESTDARDAFPCWTVSHYSSEQDRCTRRRATCHSTSSGPT